MAKDDEHVVLEVDITKLNEAQRKILQNLENKEIILELPVKHISSATQRILIQRELMKQQGLEQRLVTKAPTRHVEDTVPGEDYEELKKIANLLQPQHLEAIQYQKKLQHDEIDNHEETTTPNLSSNKIKSTDAKLKPSTAQKKKDYAEAAKILQQLVNQPKKRQAKIETDSRAKKQIINIKTKGEQTR